MMAAKTLSQQVLPAKICNFVDFLSWRFSARHNALEYMLLGKIQYAYMILVSAAFVYHVAPVKACASLALYLFVCAHFITGSEVTKAPSLLTLSDSILPTASNDKETVSLDHFTNDTTQHPIDSANTQVDVIRGDFEKLASEGAAKGIRAQALTRLLTAIR